MPFGDGTGPLGLGPMTGRAAGYCAGFGVPGFMNPYIGRLGFWRGFGRGWFWRRAFYGYPFPYGIVPPVIPPYGVGTLTSEQEKQILLEQTRMLEEQINELKKRIAELEREKK